MGNIIAAIVLGVIAIICFVISYFQFNEKEMNKEEKFINNKALLNVKEMCECLGIGQTKARELIANPSKNFTVRIGNGLYAHKGRLDRWLINQIM